MKTRYWLRGILIAFIVFLVWVGIVSIEDNINKNIFFKIIENITLFLMYIPEKFNQILVPLFCKETGWFACFGQSLVVGFSSALIEVLCIGAFLGGLYGKIKNRNKMIQ